MRIMFIKYPQGTECLFNFVVPLVTLDFIYITSIKCPSLWNKISDRLLRLKYLQTFSKLLKMTAKFGGELNDFPACYLEQLQCYAAVNEACQLDY